MYDDEALFSLANAYLLRAAYRVDHDKGMWGAARDGARSKRLADAYVKRHPEHGAAYLALGTYNYYVEIAPAFVKWIRPLLFLPAGDRAGRLTQLERARRAGSSLFSALYRAQLGLASGGSGCFVGGRGLGRLSAVGGCGTIRASLDGRE